MDEEIAITQELISVTSGLVPLSYFLTDETPNRQRTLSAATGSTGTSTNSPMQIRNKSLSFDMGLSNPNGVQKKINAETNEIHLEEGYSINDQMFHDEKLYSIYNKAKSFRDHMYSEEIELSDEFMDAFTIVEDLIDIREAIKCREWMKARTVLLKLENELMGSDNAKVMEELSLNKSLIVTFAIIHAYYNTIKAGLNFGPIGMPDYKNISLDALEEAIRMYENAPDSVRSKLEVLHCTLLSLHSLRKAQKQGNWKEIATVLEKFQQDVNTFKASDLVSNEISRANIEKENYECITAVKNALINEEIFCKDGLLDIEQISVKDLTAALAKISQIPEDTRGIILKPLHILSDGVLKARRAAAQKNWYLLESLLPLLKENIDTFQNEIDGKDRLVLHRKTLALRASNLHRGTMMVKDRAGSGKMSIMDPGGGAGGMLVRSATWDEYAEVNQSIKREIKAIEHHFAVKELEKALPEKLCRHGIQANEDKTINIQNIKVEELVEILDHAESLESSNLSLPLALKATKKIGLLIVKLRAAVINNKWDEIKSLLDETLQLEMSQMPEYNRIEIQIARREVENLWIIQNLTTAIMSGSLQSDGDSWQVSSQHLPSFIQTVRSLQPRSEHANFLCLTGERILTLRELLEQSKTKSGPANVIPWKTVISTAKQIELEIKEGKLDSMIANEVSLCIQIANDRQICEQLEQAVVTGAITGEPGNIQYSGISTSLLAKTCKQTSLSSLKSVYSQILYEVAKNIYQLRETCCYLQETLQKSAENSYDSSKIKTIITHIKNIVTELRALKLKHKTLSVWNLCEKEISVVEKHMLLEELRHSLIDTVNKASYLYSMKHNQPIQNFVKIEDRFFDEYRVLFSELDDLIQFYEKFTTNSQYDFLQKFVHCATTLRMLRSSILDENWSQLENLLKNDLFAQALSIIPEVAGEHAWVVCELHNSIAWSNLYSALSGSKHIHSIAPANYDINDIKVWDLENLYEKGYSDRNKSLLTVLSSLKEYHITAVRSKQALTCCSHLYTIRHRLHFILPNIIDSTTFAKQPISDGESGVLLQPKMFTQYQQELIEAFSWFHAHPLDCVPCIKLEVQQAFIFYQNLLFVQSLKLALREGKPQGKCGEINRELIKTDDMESLIQQSEKIPPKYRLDVLNQLLAAARFSLRIRAGLLRDDYESLQDIMDEIVMLTDDIGGDSDATFSRSIQFYILEEILIARTEIDNSISCNALIKALKSFRLPQLGYLRCVFIQSFQKDYCKSCTSTDIPIAKNLIDAIEELIVSLQSDVAKQKLLSFLEDLPIDLIGEEGTNFQIRKIEDSSVPPSPSTMVRNSSYFFAQSSSSTFDVNNAILSQGVMDNNDINPLDQGIRISHDHGVNSWKAKVLYNTVLLTKVLRLALRSGQWQLVGDLLSTVEFENYLDVEYDSLSLMELESVSLQCRICQVLWKINHLLDPSFWVKINHGMVKEAANATLINEQLLFTLQFGEQLLNELLQLFHENEEDDNYEETSDIVVTFIMPMIQEHIQPFIQSAKLIYVVRELLLMGQCYEAGKLAFQHLQVFSSPTSTSIIDDSINLPVIPSIMNELIVRKQIVTDHLHSNVLDELSYYQEELYAYLEFQQRIKSLQYAFNMNQSLNTCIQGDSSYLVNKMMVSQDISSDKQKSAITAQGKRGSKISLDTPISSERSDISREALLCHMESHLADFYQISPSIFATKNLGYSALFIDYFGCYEALLKCKDEIQKHKNYLAQSSSALSDRNTLTTRWFPDTISKSSTTSSSDKSAHDDKLVAIDYPHLLQYFLSRYQRMAHHYHDEDVIYLQSQHRHLQNFLSTLTASWIEFLYSNVSVLPSNNVHSNIIGHLQQLLSQNIQSFPIIHTHRLTAQTKLFIYLTSIKCSAVIDNNPKAARKSVTANNNRSSFASNNIIDATDTSKLKGDKANNQSISTHQYILSLLQLEKALLLSDSVTEVISSQDEGDNKSQSFQHSYTNSNHRNCRESLKRMLCVEGMLKFSTNYKQNLFLQICSSKFNPTQPATTKPSQFQELTSVQFLECFPLQSYKRLRKVEDYAYRRNLLSVELQTTFLSYSNQSLPTSLTDLPPYVATIGVFVFSRYIQAFEHCNFSYPEFLLHHLVTIGCNSVKMRDEIYCQIMKQLTFHPDYIQYCQHLQQTIVNLTPAPISTLPPPNPILANVVQTNNPSSTNENSTNNPSSAATHAMILFRIEKVLRLWKLLTVCLYYFPPSQELENILECFLYRHLVEYQYILTKQSFQPAAAMTTLPNVQTPPPSTPNNAANSAVAKKRVPDPVAKPVPLGGLHDGNDSCAAQKELVWQEFSPYFNTSISWIERSLRYLHRSVCLYGYENAYPLSHCDRYSTLHFPGQPPLPIDAVGTITNEFSYWIKLDLKYDPSNLSSVLALYQTATATATSPPSSSS